MDLLSITISVAGYLRELTGESWQPKPYDQPEEWNGIICADGRKITLHSDKKTHIRVTGDYPRTKSGDMYYRYFTSYEDAPKRRVSAAKPPQTIASDIAKFFLPAYNDLYAKCVEMKQRDEEAEAARISLEKRRRQLIEAILKVSLEGRNSKALFGKDIGDDDRYSYAEITRFDTGQVDINIHNLRDDLIEAVIVLLTTPKLDLIPMPDHYKIL